LRWNKSSLKQYKQISFKRSRLLGYRIISYASSCDFIQKTWSERRPVRRRPLLIRYKEFAMILRAVSVGLLTRRYDTCRQEAKCFWKGTVSLQILVLLQENSATGQCQQHIVYLEPNESSMLLIYIYKITTCIIYVNTL